MLFFSSAHRPALRTLQHVRNVAIAKYSKKYASTSPTALIFDTETTGKVDFKRPSSDPIQPDLVQLGMLLVDTSTWDVRFSSSLLVNLREGVAIESGAQATHGISEADCRAYGVHPNTAARLFHDVSKRADVVVAHNISFDAAVMEAALRRSDLDSSAMASLKRKRQICTMQSTTDLLKIPGKFGSTYKWPTLSEAYHYVAQEELQGGHDALVDATACLRVFRHLVKEGVVQLPPGKQQFEREQEKDEEKTDSLSQTSEIKAELVESRLVVKKSAHGFTISGNTFAVKDMLKANGGEWDIRRKEWVFFGPYGTLARARELVQQLQPGPLTGRQRQRLRNSQR